jgi:hypothetical protein
MRSMCAEDSGSPEIGVFGGPLASHRWLLYMVDDEVLDQPSRSCELESKLLLHTLEDRREFLHLWRQTVPAKHSAEALAQTTV